MIKKIGTGSFALLCDAQPEAASSTESHEFPEKKLKEDLDVFSTSNLVHNKAQKGESVGGGQKPKIRFSQQRSKVHKEEKKYVSLSPFRPFLRVLVVKEAFCFQASTPKKQS